MVVLRSSPDHPQPPPTVWSRNSKEIARYKGAPDPFTRTARARNSTDRWFGEYVLGLDNSTLSMNWMMQVTSLPQIRGYLDGPKRYPFPKGAEGLPGARPSVPAQPPPRGCGSVPRKENRRKVLGRVVVCRSSG